MVPAKKTCPQKLLVERKEYFAKGKRGIASLAFVNGKRVLVKEWNPSSDVDTISHEADMLKAVNTVGVGPLFIALQDNMLIREFVDGVEVMDWMPDASKSAAKKVLLDVLDQCRKLDKIGINKLEMTHPHKHVLIVRGKPVMIDFDRSRRSEHPKNVTQVVQWITGKEMAAALAPKQIVLPRDVMLAHARSYKEQYSSTAYARIVEVIRNA